jgi:hypothetical protein
MDRCPRISVAFVLEEAELTGCLLSRQQPFHDDACKNEFLAVAIVHRRFLSKDRAEDGGGSRPAYSGSPAPLEAVPAVCGDV